MSEYPHQHQGACACGAVQFTFSSSDDLEALVPRACQCEFCLPGAVSYLSDPAGRLEVRVKDRRYLYAHVFGTGTADFMHCAACNHLVFVRSEIDGQLYGLAVVQALDAWPLSLATQAMNYDGESLQERVQRRADNWIQQVEVSVIGE
ncbi:MAG: hypothetical protein ABJ308_18550 [Halieaceae bacterium]